MWWFFGFLVFTMMVAFYAGTETGVYSISRAHLNARADSGDTRAVLLNDMISNPELLVATTLVGTNIGIEAATIAGSHIVYELLGLKSGAAASEIITTLAVAPFLFLFADLVPKAVFQANADNLMYPCSKFLGISVVIFRPVSFVLEKITSGLRLLLPARKQGDEGVDFGDRRVLERMLKVSSEILSHSQTRLTSNVLDLGQVPVSRVIRSLNSLPIVKTGVDVKTAGQAAADLKSPILLVRDKNGEINGVADLLETLYRPVSQQDRLPVRPVFELDPALSVLSAATLLRRAGARAGLVKRRGQNPMGVITTRELNRLILSGFSR